MSKEETEANRTKECKGEYVFKQQIHNGNDAYKCNICNNVIVAKTLKSSKCKTIIEKK